jgi:hypothetical protein
MAHGRCNDTTASSSPAGEPSGSEQPPSEREEAGGGDGWAGGIWLWPAAAGTAADGGSLASPIASPTEESLLSCVLSSLLKYLFSDFRDDKSK